jgi:hypothetical protein
MELIYEEYLNRLKDTVDRKSSVGRLSYWLEKNTTLFGNPYSFEGHEYQREILDSTHHNAVIIKPSQVGATEAVIRLLLGFLATNNGVVALHLLPTLGEAQRASKSRIDPVIRGSSYLSSIMSPGADSSSFKQLGDSQLFTGGTFGKAVISIPTDFLSIDELDFCNQEIVATAESRMRHSRFVDQATGARGFKRKFSTPTGSGVGVDGLFSQSDMRRRLARCSCGHWFWPQFLEHCVVDGWDQAFHEMTYLDVIDLEQRGKVDTARILCPACRNPLKQERLSPEYREWVAEKPSITHLQGWHISPFDLHRHHTPSSVMREMVGYSSNVNHFRNFVLGLPYSDASNSVIDSVVQDNTVVSPIFPDSGAGGCVAGLDVGRVSWLVVGRPNYNTKCLEVIYIEKISLRDEAAQHSLYKKVMERLRAYGIVRFIPDAMPYTDTVLSIQERWGGVYPNFYKLQDKKLPAYQLVDTDLETLCASNRTKSLNNLVKSINTGKIKFPIMEETKVMRKHLQGMKRVDRVDETGEEHSDWIKCGEDHYFHALNYCNIAYESVMAEIAYSWSPGVGIREVVVGSKAYELLS